ncbi:MAG: hypothetical protein WAV11_01665 [Minisyncoccia bacterium]
MPKTKIQKPTDSSIPALVEVPDNYLLNELEGNKHIDHKIKEMVRGFILEDKDIDKEIEKVVNKIEKEKVKIFLTKIVFGIWSVAMILLGALLPVIIDKIR